ncbi:hypothetical protein [Flindersiella endophytica]
MSRWAVWLIAAFVVAILGIKVLHIDPSVWTVVATGLALAVAYLVVHELPLGGILDVVTTSRRQRRVRRHELRQVGFGGSLPKAARYSDSRDLDARGPVERRLAADEPEPSGGRELPGYVPRDIDPLIDEYLANSGLVILEGPQASGKTRTAYAALGRADGHRRLIVPSDPLALRHLADVHDNARDAIVWLDDLELYLREGGLDAHVLEKLSGLTLLATLRSEERSALEALDGKLGRDIAQVLGRATVIAIPSAWTAEEFRRADETDDPLLAAAMSNRHGLQITEYLAAAPQLYARWRGARDGRQALGGAIVTAALDARRCGFSGPVPRALLTALAPHYLAPHELRWGTADAFDDAFAWAVTPVRGLAGCLLPAYDDCFEPFDHLTTVRSATAGLESVPDPVWEVLADRMPVADVLQFVRDAQGEGRHGTAERVLVTSLISNPDDAELSAALGSVLSIDATRHDEAEDWLRRAADAGHPGAMANLGRLLAADPKRHEESERWYRKASGETRQRVAAEAEAEDQQAAVVVETSVEEGPAPVAEAGWLDAVLASERGPLVKLLDRVLGRSSAAAAERFGERVQKTLEWLADRLRRRHVSVLDPDELGPEWLPAPRLSWVLGRGVRLGAGLLETAVAMTLAVAFTAVVVTRFSATLEMPPWQAATAWLLLAAAVVAGSVRAAGRSQAVTRQPADRRFKTWGPLEAGWRWWAGALGWIVAGLYGWAAAYLVAVLVSGSRSWLLPVGGLLVLAVSAPFVIDRAGRRALRWWQPVTVKTEPYAPLYAGVGGAAVIAMVSAASTIVAAGALAFGAVRVFELGVGPAVWAGLAVAAAVGAFLHDGGLVWMRHLGTRMGAWQRGMSLSRRFFDVATEREVLVRVPAGFSFTDEEESRDLARAFRAR